MRDSVLENESLKLQLSKSQAECVADPDLVEKLQNAEQQLEELRRKLELQQQEHEVWNIFKL